MTLVQFEDIEEIAIWWDALQANSRDKVNMVSIFSAFAAVQYKFPFWRLLSCIVDQRVLE